MCSLVVLTLYLPQIESPSSESRHFTSHCPKSIPSDPHHPRIGVNPRSKNLEPQGFTQAKAWNSQIHRESPETWTQRFLPHGFFVSMRSASKKEMAPGQPSHTVHTPAFQGDPWQPDKEPEITLRSAPTKGIRRQGRVSKHQKRLSPSS